MTLSSSHYAFGAHKIPLSASADLQERVCSYQHMLCRTLNLRTVVAFVGAGCSAAFGYPTWEGLAEEMIDETREAIGARYGERLDSFARVLAKYKHDKRQCPADQLTLFIAACKSILLAEGKNKLYETIVEKLFKPSRADLDQAPPENPYKQLFALGIRRFVTTNYDVELERNLIRDRTSSRTNLLDWRRSCRLPAPSLAKAANNRSEASRKRLSTTNSSPSLH